MMVMIIVRYSPIELQLRNVNDRAIFNIEKYLFKMLRYGATAHSIPLERNGKLWRDEYS